MTALDYNLASAYVTALGCDPATTPLDLRALHDTDKALPGHAQRMTLNQAWPWVEGMNAAGYGIFMTPAALDGQGRTLEHVQTIRAHYVDLDGIDAEQQYGAAAAWSPAPSFAVSSSAGKYHVYWAVQHYPADVARFQMLQRKMRQKFNGDPKVIDAARVMRLPGTLNWKYGAPGQLVTCHAFAGYGQPLTVEQLEAALAHVVVIDGSGERHDLGDPDLAAPSLSWLKQALDLTDPNMLDRGEWIGFTAGVKQAGWTLTDESTLYALWSQWCARYEHNDVGENHKQWHSIRNTQLGWNSLVARVPSLKAMTAFGSKGPSITSAASVPAVGTATPPLPEPRALDCSGSMLTHLECEQYFKGCVFVESHGKILTPVGTLVNQTQFNGTYGGKDFVFNDDGKTTDEAWKAATRSRLWTIPKAHKMRFLPDRPTNEIVTDELGRRGVNTYVTPQIDMVEGDVTPFLNHIAAIIPDEGDRRILLEWMAHTVKFPGFKIPWAPVIQSTEGIGKGVIKLAMTHAVGQNYTHFPNAQELADSGGKFNGWMRNKVFILADEIKVDEKRHMVEVLKPLISEELIEIQSKGVDQEMEDNPTKWAFFTNYKDAIPVARNGRRYAIFYSPLQTEDDLLGRGMDDNYMKALFDWLKADGRRFIAHYLHHYPIERGAIPMRAPKTTSWAEAVQISRSPIERAVSEAITAGAAGFAGGWVSEIAAMKRLREVGAVRGNVPPHAVRTVLESMGYREVGRQARPYLQEDKDAMGVLYWKGGDMVDVADYGRVQGYE